MVSECAISKERAGGTEIGQMIYKAGVTVKSWFDIDRQWKALLFLISPSPLLPGAPSILSQGLDSESVRRCFREAGSVMQTSLKAVLRRTCFSNLLI